MCFLKKNFYFLLLLFFCDISFARSWNKKEKFLFCMAIYAFLEYSLGKKYLVQSFFEKNQNQKYNEKNQYQKSNEKNQQINYNLMKEKKKKEVFQPKIKQFNTNELKSGKINFKYVDPMGLGDTYYLNFDPSKPFKDFKDKINNIGTVRIEKYSLEKDKNSNNSFKEEFKEFIVKCSNQFFIEPKEKSYEEKILFWLAFFLEKKNKENYPGRCLIDQTYFFDKKLNILENLTLAQFQEFYTDPIQKWAENIIVTLDNNQPKKPQQQNLEEQKINNFQIKLQCKQNQFEFESENNFSKQSRMNKQLQQEQQKSFGQYQKSQIFIENQQKIISSDEISEPEFNSTDEIHTYEYFKKNKKNYEVSNDWEEKVKFIIKSVLDAQEHVHSLYEKALNYDFLITEDETLLHKINEHQEKIINYIGSINTYKELEYLLYSLIEVKTVDTFYILYGPFLIFEILQNILNKNDSFYSKQGFNLLPNKIKNNHDKYFANKNISFIDSLKNDVLNIFTKLGIKNEDCFNFTKNTLDLLDESSFIISYCKLIAKRILEYYYIPQIINELKKKFKFLDIEFSTCFDPGNSYSLNGIPNLLYLQQSEIKERLYIDSEMAQPCIIEQIVPYMVTYTKKDKYDNDFYKKIISSKIITSGIKSPCQSNIDMNVNLSYEIAFNITQFKDNLYNHLNNKKNPELNFESYFFSNFLRKKINFLPLPFHANKNDDDDLGLKPSCCLDASLYNNNNNIFYEKQFFKDKIQIQDVININKYLKKDKFSIIIQKKINLDTVEKNIKTYDGQPNYETFKKIREKTENIFDRNYVHFPDIDAGHYQIITQGRKCPLSKGYIKKDTYEINMDLTNFWNNSDNLALTYREKNEGDNARAVSIISIYNLPRFFLELFLKTNFCEN